MERLLALKTAILLPEPTSGWYRLGQYTMKMKEAANAPLCLLSDPDLPI